MTKEKNTRTALLTSIISLLLCVAMLIGSTFAWFTDKETTNVNTIQAGELDVLLMMKDESGDWVDAKGETLKFKTADGRDAADLFWEPGCTYELPALKIVNDGNLAFKFKALISNIEGDKQLADVLDVKISTDGTNFTDIGTLAELIADPDGFAYGFVLPENKSKDADAPDEEKAITSEHKTAGYTIALHMQEEADNDYQNKKIENMAVTVYATQYSYEKDSYNNEYDSTSEYEKLPVGDWDDNASEAETDIMVDDTQKTVAIYTAAGLAQFEKNVNGGTSYEGYTVTLQDNIDLSGHFWTPIGQTGGVTFNGTFDGNGKTISNMYVDTTASTSVTTASGLFGWMEHHTIDANRAIKNVTIDNATVKGNQYVGALVGWIGEANMWKLENCKITNSSIYATNDKAGAAIGYAFNGTVVDNFVAENCTISACRDAGQIVGCNIGGTDKVSGTATNVTVSYNGKIIEAGKDNTNINNAIIGRTA